MHFKFPHCIAIVPPWSARKIIFLNLMIRTKGQNGPIGVELTFSGTDTVEFLHKLSYINRITYRGVYGLISENYEVV